LKTKKEVLFITTGSHS